MLGAWLSPLGSSASGADCAFTVEPHSGRPPLTVRLSPTLFITSGELRWLVDGVERQLATNVAGSATLTLDTSGRHSITLVCPGIGESTQQVDVGAASDSSSPFILAVGSLIIVVLVIIAWRAGAFAVLAVRVGALFGRVGLARVAIGGTVWSAMSRAGPNWPGTLLPKYFEFTAENGQRFWVSANATERFVEYLSTHAPLSPTGQQQLLRSLGEAINAAVRRGIIWDQKMLVGEWELVFSQASSAKSLPALSHFLQRSP